MEDNNEYENKWNEMEIMKWKNNNNNNIMENNNKNKNDNNNDMMKW